MSYSTITLTVEAGLARLTLNQPEAGNPMNGGLCRELLLAANELSGRKDLRAILITSNGRFFSVGGDIQSFSQDMDSLPSKIRDWTADLHMGMARLARLDAPIVVAVHSTVMGGALALVANCDLVYAARSAKFGSAYAHIGYSCDAGTSTGLANRMGLARARRFVLLGELVNAEQAEQIGIADFVVDDAQVVAEAEKMAIKLSQGPTRAYGEIRRLFATSLAQSFEAQLEDEAQALVRVTNGSDAREGLTAFVEKRKPNFKGA